MSIIPLKVRKAISDLYQQHIETYRDCYIDTIEFTPITEKEDSSNLLEGILEQIKSSNPNLSVEDIQKLKKSYDKINSLHKKKYITLITEKEFTNKYNENVENIPISKLRDSGYKDLRILYVYIYPEEEKNQEGMLQKRKKIKED